MSDVPAAMTSPARATVVGRDAQAREATAEVLRRGGFDVTAEDDREAIVVLLADRSEPVRLRELRALTEGEPARSVVAVMPTDASNASLRRVLIAGALGIVYDHEVTHALAASVHAILAGQLAVPTALGRQIAPRPLSHREKQILGLVVLGLTNREIANRLYLAESTVKTHLSSAFRKIDARSRAEAVTRIQDPDSEYGPSILALTDRVDASAA